MTTVLNPMIAIVSAAPNVNTSLTLDTTVYIGQSQIRRSLGHTVTFYPGTTTSDQNLTIAPSTASTVIPSSPTIALALYVDGPVSVTFTVNSVVTTIMVTKALMLDCPVSSMSITNSNTSAVTAHISYIM